MFNKHSYPRLGSTTTMLSWFTKTRTRSMRRSIVMGECFNKLLENPSYLRTNANLAVFAFALDNSHSFICILSYELWPTAIHQISPSLTWFSYHRETGSTQTRQQRKSQIAKEGCKISYYFEGACTVIVDNQSFRIACPKCDLSIASISLG